MTPLVDFHAHAFPDALAAKAVPMLAAEAGEEPRLDGTVASLLHSMDRHGVQASVVCSIATKPAQFRPILDWSRDIRSDRLVPFPSIHPDDPDAVAHIDQIASEGFVGLKLHPYYQEFDLDEERIEPVYEAAAEHGLLVAIHCGHDCAFPGVDRAAPEQLARVLDRVPELRVVATHLGGWKQWNQVEQHLVGRPLLMELSMSLDLLSVEQAKRIIERHPRGCVLFGTDSPWRGYPEALEQVQALDLAPELEAEVLGDNARAVLNGALGG